MKLVTECRAYRDGKLIESTAEIEDDPDKRTREILELLRLDLYFLAR